MNKLVWLLFCSFAFGQGVIVPPQIALKTVNGITTPLANATITVCAAGASGIPCAPVTVSLFKDAALSQPLSNPFTADSMGNYSFAVPSGNYTVTVTGSGFAGYSYQITTPGGSKGGCIATATTLTSVCGAVSGEVASITDGSTPTDCTIGGGSNKNACIYNGSAWQSAGGATPGGSTLAIQYNNSGVLGGTTPGSNQGTYTPCRINTVQGTATSPVECQLGDVTGVGTITGSATTYTVLYSDIGGTIRHDRAASGAATVTIPLPSSLNNSAPVFTYENDSAQTDTLSPITYQISLGNGAAGGTLSVPGSVACKVQLDSVNASTWKADCHPVTTSSGTTAWNAITAATGNQTLNNTTFNTTITNSASTNFIVHSNTTAATNLGVNASSPTFNECGNYFTLGASAQDCWNFQDVISAGATSSTVTNVAETSGSVVTLTITGGTFVAGQQATFTGLTTATWLNSQNAFLTTATATQLTFTDPTSHGTQASHAETGQVTQSNPLSAFTVSHIGSGNGASQIMFQSGEATFGSPTPVTYPTMNIGQLSVPGRICSTTGAGNYGTGFPNYGFAMHDICPTVFTAPAPPVAGTGSQSIMGLNSGIAIAFNANTNVFAINGQIATPTSYNGAIGGGLYGMYHETDLNHTGSTHDSWGAFFANYNNSVGTCALCVGAHIEAVGNFYGGTNAAVSTSNTGLEVASGARASSTSTTDIALHILQPYTGGTFTNSHQQLVIEDGSAGGVISGAYGIQLKPSSGATPSGYTGFDLGVNNMTVESTGTGFLSLNAPTGTYGNNTFRWPLTHGYLASTPCGTGKVFLSSDFTSANASGLQAITGLSCAIPQLDGASLNVSFSCQLMYSQATNVAGDQFGVGVSGTPTNINAWANVATNTGASTPFTTGNVTGIVASGANAIVTFQPGNTGLNIASIWGTAEGVGSTFQLYVTNGTAADVIVIKRASYCQFF